MNNQANKQLTTLPHKMCLLLEISSFCTEPELFPIQSISACSPLQPHTSGEDGAIHHNLNMQGAFQTKHSTHFPSAVLILKAGARMTTAQMWQHCLVAGLRASLPSRLSASSSHTSHRAGALPFLPSCAEELLQPPQSLEVTCLTWGQQAHN